VLDGPTVRNHRDRQGHPWLAPSGLSLSDAVATWYRRLPDASARSRGRRIGHSEFEHYDGYDHRKDSI
jgi:hypothetical protein